MAGKRRGGVIANAQVDGKEEGRPSRGSFFDPTAGGGWGGGRSVSAGSKGADSFIKDSVCGVRGVLRGVNVDEITIVPHHGSNKPKFVPVAVQTIKG